jgi:hypothetical protein
VGGVEVSAVEDSYCIAIADRESFEELDEALLIVDLRAR